MAKYKDKNPRFFYFFYFLLLIDKKNTRKSLKHMSLSGICNALNDLPKQQ